MLIQNSAASFRPAAVPAANLMYISLHHPGPSAALKTGVCFLMARTPSPAGGVVTAMCCPLPNDGGASSAADDNCQDL